MAIDFPNSPTAGQTYTVGTITWTYDGAKWKSNGVANGARFAVSDTAPSTPQTGDGWFNSSDSQLYIYYDSFWVAASQNLKGDAGTSGVFSVTAPVKNTGTSTNAILGIDYSTLQYGRNAVINGGFDFWQRGTSFSAPANGTVTSDRWFIETASAPGLVVSQQTFTPGSAPATGYESQYFLRYAAGTAASVHGITHKIEDVRTFAGQTVTVSFWAKAAAATTLLIIPSQNFGTGGSAQIDATAFTPTLTTSWTRYSYSVTIPSVAGKTIGAGSYLHLRILNITNAAFTMDIWGVQVEAGSVATPFSRAGGTIQGELAACQRYYVRWSSTGAYANIGGAGNAISTTVAPVIFSAPVEMRTTPTSIDYGAISLYDGVTVITAIAVSLGGSNTKQLSAYTTVASGLTGYRNYYLLAGAVAGYVGFSAEL